jgi:PAS domain S-box-containing protein
MAKNQKILIVDDSESNLIALEKVLSELDVTVVKARSGNEALIAILNNDFALAILDVQMPEMDGYELLGLIRLEEKTKNLPVTFLSAVYSDDYHVGKGYESGAVDFVTKPYNPAHLLSKVKVFLKLDQQKSELIDKFEIEKSKNYLESILMSVNDSLIVISLDSTIERANNSASIMFGYSLDEMTYLKINDLFNYDFYSSWLQLLQTDKESASQKKETIMIAKNGEIVPVLISGSALVDNQGSIKGSVLIAIDIKIIKQAEQELIIAKEKAEEVSKLKSNFLAAMSHELRTPLMGIVGYAELLQNEVKDEKLGELTEKVLISGRRLSITLKSIMDFSKIESTNDNLVLKKTNIKEKLLVLKDSFSQLAEEKNLSFNLLFNTDRTFVLIDSELFEGIINHLIDNAIKFTSTGGVTIDVESEFVKHTEWVNIKVIDTGIGISKDKIDIIWEDFRQASEGSSRKFQGTGLGLTIAKRFTEMMKGEISVESVHGIGSVFTLKFPTLAQSESPSGTEDFDIAKEFESDAPFEIKNELPMVLYVEDDPMNRNLIGMFLKNICSIDLIDTGEEAMKVSLIKKYDVFLIDVNLGAGMDGIELTRWLRTMPEYKNVPIIAITALALDGEKESLLRSGCSHYLAKPFKKRDLVSLINSLF